MKDIRLKAKGSSEFASAMYDILSPLHQQKYLIETFEVGINDLPEIWNNFYARKIISKNPIKTESIIRKVRTAENTKYIPVPAIFSKSKTEANVFLKAWRQNMAWARLKGTRSKSGKKMLEKNS